MRNRKSGFTLLELIIVVIVIGILASIALPRYIRIAEKGRASEAKALLGALRSAQIRYSAQYNAYTTNLGLLDINLPADKYFTMTAQAPANITDEAAVIATAARTALENPGGAYSVTITMGGTLAVTNASFSWVL